MFKAMTFALATLMIATTPAMAEQSADYRVGIAAEPYPPFYEPDASGEWSGFEIDFTHALCEHIDATCKITPIAWDGIIPALKSNRIDMIIASMSITPERAQQIDFSNKYYATPTALMTLKSADIQPTPEGVEDAWLGVSTGTIQQAYAYKHFKDSAAGINVYNTYDEALQDLAAGRIDGVLGDALAMSPFLESDIGQACCQLTGNVADDPELLGSGIGVGLRQDDDALRQRINDAIATMREDGSYDEIAQKWFGDIDIYGK